MWAWVRKPDRVSHPPHPHLSPGPEHPSVEDEQGRPGGLCGSGHWAHTWRGCHLLLQVVRSGLGMGWS